MEGANVFLDDSVTKKKYGPEVWKELPEDWLQGLNIKTQVILFLVVVFDSDFNK